MKMDFARFFGIVQIRMALARGLARRKNNQRRLCDVCSRQFAAFEEMEDHRRKTHPDVVM